jgi:hypothetical protein
VPTGRPPRADEPAFEAPAELFGPSSDANAVRTVPTGLAALLTLELPANWFVPALVTGVPGLLIIILVGTNVVLGFSWLPNVGRLLGPDPEVPDHDQQFWWAAGRPIG